MMRPPTSITSSQNPHLKSAIKLRERRGRKLQNRFLIDGLKETTRAAQAGVEIVQLFFSSSPLPDETSNQIDSVPGLTDAAPFQVAPNLFSKLAFGERSEIVAVAVTPARSLSDFDVQSDSLIVILESIEKPGNIGAIARSACGAGFSGLIVTDPVTDLYNPNVIRSSLGAVFSLPVCTTQTDTLIPWLQKYGFQTIVARVDAEKSYTEMDYHRPSAIVLGNESKGLSSSWYNENFIPVFIPMVGDVDSLNVSVSGAILFYEALRQRQDR